MTYLNLNIGTVFPFFIVNVILTGWLITKHFVINDLENLKIKRIKHYLHNILSRLFILLKKTYEYEECCLNYWRQW